MDRRTRDKNTSPLLTLAIQPSGAVHAYPGRPFDPEQHMPFLVEATGAVHDVVREALTDAAGIAG